LICNFLTVKYNCLRFLALDLPSSNCAAGMRLHQYQWSLL
jgi:hypothetical protein